MKRRSVEDYQRERREREAPRTTPGDEERKERVLDHGRDCLRRVKGDTTWEDWMGIGAALMVITEGALAEVGVTVWDSNNKRLTMEFTRLWDEYEASAIETGSNQKPLSKQERWALREVMTNPHIGGWRSTLDGVNRRKLNHPNKVIERWKRATQTADKEPKKPSPSMSQALKERNEVIDQLEARNRDLEEELKGTRETAQTLDTAVISIIDQGRKRGEDERVAIINRIAAGFGFPFAKKSKQRATVPPGSKSREGKAKKDAAVKAGLKKVERDLNQVRSLFKRTAG